MRPSILLVLWLLSAFAAAEEEHWAFQPIRRPEIPHSKQGERLSNPIDHFVFAKLDAQEMAPVAPAARRDWVRRMYYNLHGLAPAHSQLQEWLAIRDVPDAKLAGRLADRLLASPRYGERWARHWLDVARYSDTKGYAYSPEEFTFVHAWPYRDWVVAAFNSDLPFNRFVERQIAADLLLAKGECDRADLAAMGLLTLGRRFVSVEPDIIDDRIDVVSRAFLGLTVSCARCHDHKFDPIPTADYYSLYGVFKSSHEKLEAIDPSRAPIAEIAKAKQELADLFSGEAEKLEQRFLDRAGEYMLAALDIASVPPPDFAEIIQPDDLNPAQIRRWYEFLSQERRRADGVFSYWLALAQLPAGSFAEQAHGTVSSLFRHGDVHVPRVVEALLADPLPDMAAVARCYGELLREAAKEGHADDPKWRVLRGIVFGPGSPIAIPREHIHDVEWLFDEKTKEAIKKRLSNLERAIIKAGDAAPHAVVLRDRPVAQNVHVFKRGQYPDQGDEVARGSLTILGKGKRSAFVEGSGRLALAREITRPDNPLTARVIVNRVWQQHFGSGLVRTESDFGLRSDPPSHSALLDYLASELIENDWSIKHLQRLIVTSGVFRLRAGVAPASDPDNRLLSVFPRRRLDFEAMRDSMLQASGELDLRTGGPPGPLFGQGASLRRSLYGRIDRQFLPSPLRVFDFANPELHSPRRYQTNVPQQALFLMNSPFVRGRLEALAARALAEGGADPEDRVRALYAAVYQREPTAQQLERGLAFVAQGKPASDEVQAPVANAWSYGFGEFDAGKGRIASFTALPHFDGKAWGGGEAWPDAALGWLRLTAEGGHVGNTVKQAAVRRWTASGAGRLAITGRVAKVEDCGDGLRAWISSDRRGVLGAWRVNFGVPVDTAVDGVQVEAGEIIDFIVDCGAGGNFSCDGFTWSPVIAISKGADKQLSDAKAQFGGQLTLPDQLDPWQRLAQALLISNEFMFLD